MTDGVSARVTPEQHYQAGLDALRRGQEMQFGSPDYTNCLLTVIAHALMGALDCELEYRARQRVSPSSPPEYAPRIEEDDDRP